MNILLLLIPISLFLGLFFLGSFIWAVKKGQYDSLDTDQAKLLLDTEDDYTT